MDDDPTAVEHAAQTIRAGGLVAFPTETVYGLGANATDADAVAKIYAAKQRALNDPLIVHCAPPDDDMAGPLNLRELIGNRAPFVLEELARQRIIGALSIAQRLRANALIGSFWPGPLTLVLPRGSRIPLNVTAGLDTVAVRMPAHPVALALIRRSGVPIAAPSANRFGHVSPTVARHVLDDLDGRIDVLLDGGPTPIGVESTVVDLTAYQPVILRPGGLGREDIERVIGKLGTLEQGSGGAGEHGAAQSSPGTLSKHYAPRAELRVASDTPHLLALHAECVARGLRPGLLVMAGQRDACAGLEPQFVLGKDLADAARNLYAGLRALDDDGVDVILVSAVEQAGIGE
ncbi:MAG: L-threonylcarbamoyladenylate synthase, partial [Chloroflexi bacterium]|nr:L-threonylcarbamoyladenylate synthase [Chloroflexota bacterium]